MSEKKRASTSARARGGDDKTLIQRAKKLVELLKPEYLEKAVRVWVDGLEATRETYDPKSRTWSGQPDWKERRENANMIVAYFEGRPVERQMVIGGKFEDYQAMMSRVSLSPEAQRALFQETGPENVIDVASETAEVSSNSD